MSDLHGVVYTKSWVANLILDIAGYTVDKPLWEQVIMEPACGNGVFLTLIVERLVSSLLRNGKNVTASLRDCILSYDLDPIAVETSRAAIIKVLTSKGVPRANAENLAMCWVKHGDYLLSETVKCDYVVGNPPYLRATEISKDMRKEYCARYSTMTMGCDLFVGFIQRGLESLKDSTGVLCFICADRWMQNQYGRKLREFIVKNYHINTIVKMHEVKSFETDVSAYPAIMRIDYDEGDMKYIDCNEKFGEYNTSEMTEWMAGVQLDYTGSTFSATTLSQPKEGDIFPLATPQKIKTVVNLTRRFPSLERAGVRLGIGLATGRDDLFIVHDPDLVEQDRLLPAFNMKDWRKGNRDKKCWIVNPWKSDGTLVELSDYPKLNAYFDQNKAEISSRHIARKNANTWYRTIDKVNWEIYGTPMLLFPDIASKAEPIYCDGTKYPCHNCYWLISDRWDIKVLGGLLMSDIVESFIDTLGVKMRGGAMRFQAQYLRLIHVPEPEKIDKDISLQLRSAFENSDRIAANKAALVAYGLESKI